MESLLKRLGADLEETSRFPNIELLETDEDFVYFDVRDNLAASPVQTYLELMQGDKREQEAAEQLRKTILQPLKKKGWADMAWMDPLTANLLDLLFELHEHPVPLTIGGGFGLYLKRMRLDETRERTLFSQLPMPRATNDLDLFVRADVLCDLQSMKAVAAALDRLGYEVVPEAK